MGGDSSRGACIGLIYKGKALICVVAGQRFLREVMRYLEEKSVKSCKNLFQMDGHQLQEFGLSEQSVAVREQGGDEDAAEEDAADELAGADGQCQEPERARDRVGIAENQRDDDAV